LKEKGKHIIICLICLLAIKLSVTQGFKSDTVLQLSTLFKDSLENTTPPKAKIGRKVLADSLLKISNQYLGDRYARGGTGKRGFDCSGFTLVVYKQLGIKLPHTSAGQSLYGIQISRNQIDKGDLLFFRSRNRRSKRIGHVGIVISNKGEDIQFIHSSTSAGVRIDRLSAVYYQKRFMKAMRVLPMYQ
jgi:cell wall-associated NlpC family hydrolase